TRSKRDWSSDVCSSDLKLREVLSKQERQDLALRVYVTPGGCSGFSYGMTFADGTEEDDAIIEQDGVRVVVDPMSAMYLKGSEIEIGRASCRERVEEREV